MKSIRHVVMLCLVAAFAVFAFASTASAAGSPTWFACVKSAKNLENKYTGKYTDKLCTTEASEAQIAEGKANKYELAESLGKGKEIKGKGGVAVLHVKTWLGDNTVECQKSKSVGKPELPNREKEVSISFSKCVALTVHTCTSPGANKGEIKLSGLKGELGYLEEEPTKVGLKLESEANPGPEGELGFFECENLNVKVIGGVIGEVTGDVNTISKVSSVNYLATESIGEHEFEGKKYKPLVNPLGWFSEKAEYEKETEEDLKGEKAKIVRPIIKAIVCGEFIENLLHVECTPEAYAGLDQSVALKGEALMIKA
jgi:hypothetical protein